MFSIFGTNNLKKMAWETGTQKLHREFKDINQSILEKEGYLEETEAKILLYKFLRENPSFACDDGV